LKDGGNEAVREGKWSSAVRRYDKAIQYCAVALMEYQSNQDLNRGNIWTQEDDLETLQFNRATVPVIQKWTALTRVLVSCHLNLAMLGLKEEVKDVDARMTVMQAESALRVLAPFAFSRGKVVYVDETKKQHSVRDEVDSTFDEVKPLEAKAYYRLGVAQLQLSDYARAVASLEASVAAMNVTAKGSGGCSNETKSTMNAVLRKLHEAKRMHNEQKQRYRQRYQRALEKDGVKQDRDR
jgi:tetratricopeptide (TPR) repeat protein